MTKTMRISLLASTALLATSLVTGFAATITANPTGVGTYNAWTPSTGSTHYTLVDESSCNGVTDYVSTTTTGTRDSYTVSVSGIPNASTITAIAIRPCASRASGGGAGTGVLNVFYRLNGINSADSGAYAITGTTPTNLATTTFSGLSVVKNGSTTLEIGAVFTSGNKGARLSKIATVITYTPVVNYTIFASAGANGTISPLGTTTLASGSNQTYTITATSGYAIANVLVDGSSVGATSSYVFTNVLANHTISATFTPIVVNAPSDLAATTTPGKIALTWTDNATNENYFAVERKLTATSTWALLATTTANSVSYNDFAVASSTSYDYRVRAFGFFSGFWISSLYSSIVTAVTP